MPKQQINNFPNSLLSHPVYEFPRHRRVVNGVAQVVRHHRVIRAHTSELHEDVESEFFEIFFAVKIVVKLIIVESLIKVVWRTCDDTVDGFGRQQLHSFATIALNQHAHAGKRKRATNSSSRRKKNGRRKRRG